MGENCATIRNQMGIKQRRQQSWQNTQGKKRERTHQTSGVLRTNERTINTRRAGTARGNSRDKHQQQFPRKNKGQKTSAAPVAKTKETRPTAILHLQEGFCPNHGQERVRADDHEVRKVEQHLRRESGRCAENASNWPSRGAAGRRESPTNRTDSLVARAQSRR